MNEYNIDYEKMVEEALRGVVLSTLRSVEAHGLPSGHHLYISFMTDFPGVEIAATLHDEFPDEMTIVLQNQFWNLEVNNAGFRVTLNFNKVPHELVIPVEALTGFADPHSEFSLRFGKGETPLTAGDRTSKKDSEDSKPPNMEAKPDEPTHKIVKLDSFRKP